MRDKVTVQVNKIVRRNCQHLYACKHGVQEVFLCTQQSRSARASPVHQSPQWDALDLVPLNSHEVDVLGPVNSLVNWDALDVPATATVTVDRAGPVRVDVLSRSGRAVFFQQSRSCDALDIVEMLISKIQAVLNWNHQQQKMSSRWSFTFQRTELCWCWLSRLSCSLM